MAQPQADALTTHIIENLTHAVAQDGDPYSAVMSLIVCALETGLRPDVAGGMSESEHTALVRLAMACQDIDPYVRIDLGN